MSINRINCQLWLRGVVVITTAQLHSTKPKLRFCAGSKPACGVSEIRDGEDLWQWSRLEIRLDVFRRSTIPQKQFITILIIIIIIIIIKYWKVNIKIRNIISNCIYTIYGQLCLLPKAWKIVKQNFILILKIPRLFSNLISSHVNAHCNSKKFN